ncbi:transcriptional regulator, LacI family [Nocardioides terrae]|uniref:Transcriptional regulator, LacI family n=1 Tax=Nocardioides terrae TaxID=574651 RepID=A0A1I1KGH7_9ACTN|nr:LacI family DNA-binding transcriptional regulator [Nocardioides terrae]SFC56570.1 transcriptional regulator, LacI family [Nocardioides terrae]
MITSKDVARLAGVSQPTVSRALNDHPKVSAATKQKVREAARALGYAPSAVGRALSTGRTTRVGLVVTDLDNQFYSYVIAPMHDELGRLGHELVLVTEADETGPIAERLISLGLAGVVLATTTVDSILPARLQDRGMPFVYFNRVAGVEADAVVVDPSAGVEALARAVADAGHKRAAAIFGPHNTSTGEERERAMRAALEEVGISLSQRDVVHGPFDFESGRRGAHELLGRDGAPSLLICANDLVALGALNAAAELDIDVPGRVSIIGFDDLPPSRWALVQLSTVAYDLEAMSREAARLIVSRVQGDRGAPARRVAFGTTWVPRATVGPSPR